MWVFLKELALIQEWKSFQGCQLERMPESTNSPWIKAFVLLFAYTFAIPSQLNLNKLSKHQSGIILALKPRMLLKLRGSHWHSGPPNPLQRPPRPSRPTERHFSCPAQVRTLHGSPSNSAHDGITRANSGTKPWQALTGVWGRGSLGLPTGQGEGGGGSDALSWSQAVPAVPSLHKHSALTYLPRITQGDCSLCPHTLSWPIYQQDWGKTSWWKYAPMVSTRLLIFRTSTSILK